jgi:hypothetical protein
MKILTIPWDWDKSLQKLWNKFRGKKVNTIMPCGGKKPTGKKPKKK